MNDNQTMGGIPILNPKTAKERIESEKMRKLEEETRRRYNEIVELIVDIFRKNNVSIKEFTGIVATLSAKINNKIDNTPVDKILDL